MTIEVGASGEEPEVKVVEHQKLYEKQMIQKSKNWNLTMQKEPNK